MRRGKRVLSSPYDNAGRWSLLQPPEQQTADERDIEFLAKILLRRYGVVFRKLLEREPIVPSWRDLLHVYWRMEARGEIRGGRFVQGVAGEQFALPDAIATLRTVRRAPETGKLISISASDPLNLLGILIPGDRIPALRSNRILFRDGLAIAVQSNKDIRFLDELDEEAVWQAKLHLTQKRQLANVDRSLARQI